MWPLTLWVRCDVSYLQTIAKWWRNIFPTLVSWYNVLFQYDGMVSMVWYGMFTDSSLVCKTMWLHSHILQYQTVKPYHPSCCCIHRIAEAKGETKIKMLRCFAATIAIIDALIFPLALVTFGILRTLMTFISLSVSLESKPGMLFINWTIWSTVVENNFLFARGGHNKWKRKGRENTRLSQHQLCLKPRF